MLSTTPVPGPVPPTGRTLALDDPELGFEVVLEPGL
jgi:hypothetical protein